MITKNDIEKLVAEKLKDSGWIDATFSTKVVPVGDYKTYRLIGNILYINMTLTINEAVSTNKILFTLPEGYRPDRNHSFTCTIGSASATTRTVQFTPDGVVKFYVSGGTLSSGSTIYLDFNFPID